MKEKVIHPSMQRLYHAAQTLRQKSGQSEVARLLNASPQKVKNWEKRGISKGGAIDAQAKIGCSSVWVTDGIGEMVGKTGPVGNETPPISPAPTPPPSQPGPATVNVAGWSYQALEAAVLINMLNRPEDRAEIMEQIKAKVRAQTL